MDDNHFLDALENAVVPVVHLGRLAARESQSGGAQEKNLFQPFVFDRNGVQELLTCCRQDRAAAELVRQAVAKEAAACQTDRERFHQMAADMVALESCTSSSRGVRSALTSRELPPAMRGKLQAGSHTIQQHVGNPVFRGHDALAVALCALAEAPLIDPWHLNLLVLAFVQDPAAWDRWEQAVG